LPSLPAGRRAFEKAAYGDRVETPLCVVSRIRGLP